jgi:hypothetical protein
MRIRSGVLWLAVLCLITSSSLFLAACGGKSSPAGPSSNPSPRPVAVSTATPIPTPKGTPLPGLSCNLPPSGPSNNCISREDGDGKFRPDVDGAISDLMAQQPNIFDGISIKDLGAYRVGILQNLEARGYCAMWDGDDIGIKKGTNDISEHYHVDISSGIIQRGSGAYTWRCHPATFPADPTPLPQRGDCSMPSSAAYGCSRLDEDGAMFVSVMNDIETAIAANHPDLTDGRFVTSGRENDYYQAIVAGLKDRGFCAFQDGDMINMKLISANNSYSEWYHPLLSSGQVFTGYQAYRGTCRPAVF